MGELTNFTVNDDGSVTVANGPTGSKRTNKQEANILDIFRIEKAKGGPFASRRMKKRALKYAKQANVPEHIVEKLMLDNYPNEFACYPKTTLLIVWFSTIASFLLGTIIFAFPTYIKYDDYSYYNKQYEEVLNKTCENHGNYIYVDGQYVGGKKYFNYVTDEKYNDLLEQINRFRKNNLNDMLCFLFADLACLLIAGVGIWQYRKVRKSIIKTTTKQYDNVQ